MNTFTITKLILVGMIMVFASGCSFSQTYRIEAGYRYPAESSEIKAVVELRK